MMEGFVSLKLILNGGMVAIASMLSYLGLNKEAFTIFGYLLLIDYITGVLKAKTLNECITSNKMKYGVISKFSLVLIPLVLALAAKSLHGDAENMLYVGMNILILSETYSIIGNIYTIRTREKLPEWDAVAALGHKIRSVLIRLSGDEK
ncbi:phage holin family protein [Sulfurovum sp. XTW-4]|uniref:Phage holin family protein n=1 Tax=Sulfurovum xiamenensis TaxID=3019066 RepID=A0ABT7QV66_9BACT|nr:phage holin family protein [Sulfurovum xiamenensis]MDM5264667.1 phage holin family protein [Sulfurovum xiamenensis]